MNKKSVKKAAAKKSRLRRVDLQVSVFTAVIMMSAILCIYVIYYHVTYLDMIKGLEDRVMSIYDYVEDNLDKSTFFEINTKEDESKSSYLENKLMMESIKSATGVRYLYTAKMDGNGSFIYIIDGLDSGASDFRHAGDLIEPEIREDLLTALSGKLVLPKNIMKTTWGKVFVTYLPIHENDKVIGVIGVEFEAEHQYDTYRNLRIITPVIAVLACLISMILAVLFFKRISNPSYKDMANTDQLTQLKNRNAYLIDLENMQAQHLEVGRGFLVMDLNNLKKVNDTWGHQAGDAYLKCAAEAMCAAAGKTEILYRTGGDEFVAIIKNADAFQIKSFMNQINKNMAGNMLEYGSEFSIAMGSAIYDSNLDADLEKTYQRADDQMYINKRKFHEQAGIN